MVLNPKIIWYRLVRYLRLPFSGASFDSFELMSNINYQNVGIRNFANSALWDLNTEDYCRVWQWHRSDVESKLRKINTNVIFILLKEFVPLDEFLIVIVSLTFFNRAHVLNVAFSTKFSNELRTDLDTN